MIRDEVVGTYTSSGPPTRYGDAGVIRRKETERRRDGETKVRTLAHEHDNARVVATCAMDGYEVFATSDPDDRAHNERDKAQMLKQARDVMHTRARQYPACYMVRGLVSFETACESVGRLEEHLRGELGLGHAVIPRMPPIEDAILRYGYDRVYNATKRETTMGMPKDSTSGERAVWAMEERIELEADRWLEGVR